MDRYFDKGWRQPDGPPAHGARTPPPAGGPAPVTQPAWVWAWRAPPGWPPAPPGWVPPAGWQPPPEWPPAPPGWQFWVPAPAPGVPGGPGTYAGWVPVPPAPPVVEALEFPQPQPPLGRRTLVVEIWAVMACFLWPSVTAAVVALAEGIAGGTEHRFPSLIAGNDTFNFVFGILGYLPLIAVVPVTLYLLARTGQGPRWLGLGVPRFRADVLPGLGLAAASFGVEFGVIVILTPLIVHAKHLFEQVPTGSVPTYYIAFGLVISLVTAITEEVMVNGYLITRLGQLGWAPNAALTLSLVLRTSYHVYYGLGFLLTIPFGWFVTRSFQKHRRLNRAIAAHFLFDATLMTVSLAPGPWKACLVLPFAGLVLVSACFSRRPAPEVPG